MAVDIPMQLSLQDMLINYFKQHHFNKMSENVRAKFDEHVKNNDLVGNMKDWKANLYDKDGLKDPVEAIKNISDDELIELYKDIRGRLQNLDQERKLAKNGKLDPEHPATQFLEEYFGDGNMFHESKVDEKASTIIEKMFNIDNQDLKVALNSGLSAVKKSANNANNKYTPEELKTKVINKDYNKDPEFRRDLQKILNAALNNLYYYNDDPEIKKIRYELSDLVSNGFDPNPSKSEIEDFREELPAILNQVYAKKKLRETLFAGSVFANACGTAREEVDYDREGSENFIVGKTDDELTFMQLLKKNITDKYEDYLEKYTHGGYDHLYKSREAKEIMGAIKKVGIKKTDGLSKILDESGKIKEKAVAKMKKAGPHLDWFVKEFTKLKKDMPKAFDGCLNNGWQLSRIVQQLIMDAVEADKIDEAKTAMEMLIVMQYGNTTSKLMENIRADKDLFTLFSNKDLSWNKNEAVASVTGALDKTIRIGALAVGYGLTFLYNNIRQLGGKISKKDGNKFFKAEQEKRAAHNDDLETKQAKLARAEARINKYETQLGLDDAKKAELAANGQSIEDFVKEQRNVLANERDNIEAKFLKTDNLNKKLDVLANDVLYNLIGTVPENIIDLGQAYISALREAINEGVSIEELPPIPEQLLANAETKKYFNELQNLFDTEQQNLKDFDAKQEQLNKFNEASAELNMATEQRNKYQEQIKNFDSSKKNKFDTLVDYWNTLMQDSKIFGQQRKWIGSTKNAQKAYFDQLAANKGK